MESIKYASSFNKQISQKNASSKQEHEEEKACDDQDEIKSKIKKTEEVLNLTINKSQSCISINTSNKRKKKPIRKDLINYKLLEENQNDEGDMEVEVEEDNDNEINENNDVKNNETDEIEIDQSSKINEYINGNHLDEEDILLRDMQESKSNLNNISNEENDEYLEEYDQNDENEEEEQDQLVSFQSNESLNSNNNNKNNFLSINTIIEQHQEYKQKKEDYNSFKQKQQNYSNNSGAKTNVQTISSKPSANKTASNTLNQNKHQVLVTSTPSQQQQPPHQGTSSTKKQMRFQCRFCIYKSHSVSLMQNHIYRHIDTTPYSCFYCGHKSTTKSTIMVHIELCHPNMEVKIKESRVKEEDYYLDLNGNGNSSTQANNLNSLQNQTNHSQIQSGSKVNKANQHQAAIYISQNRLKHENFSINTNKFEIIPNKCQMNSMTSNEIQTENNKNEFIPPAALSTSSTISSPPPSLSEPSSLCSSPCLSPKQQNISNKTHKSISNHDETNEQSKSSNHSFEGVSLEEDPNKDNYITVFNRPKQYFGSLYEPDKQYSCKLCTYTTNHKPSMEDHVYVHTNKRPYRCGYCNEEIYTRYAATYHNKYKHPGEARNFIKDEQDVSIYYVNRAKKNGNGGTINASTPTNNSCNGSSSSSSTSSSTSSTITLNEEDVANNNSKNESNNGNLKRLSKNINDESVSKKQAIHPHQQQSQTMTFNVENKKNLLVVTNSNKTLLNKNQQVNEKLEEITDDKNQNHQQISGSSAAAALAQLMLATNAAAALQQQTTIAPQNSSSSVNSSSSSSPASSTASTSTLLNANNSINITSPQMTNSPINIAQGAHPIHSLHSHPYDFNLALKMYQIQLQSLMAANYLQQTIGVTNNIRPSATTISSSTPRNQLQSNQQQQQFFASYFAGLNNNQDLAALAAAAALAATNNNKVNNTANNNNKAFNSNFNNQLISNESQNDNNENNDDDFLTNENEKFENVKHIEEKDDYENTNIKKNSKIVSNKSTALNKTSRNISNNKSIKNK